MNVTLRRASAVALLAMGGTTLASACVRNESSIFIRGCLSVPRDSCTVQASVNATFLLDGMIDSVYKAEYECLAMFENQIVPRGDVNKLRTETSRIEVYQAEVQVLNDDPTSPSAFAQFTVPVSGFADPGSGAEPGLGITNIVMIDSNTAKQLGKTALASNKQQLVVASVVLHGRTLGGLEVESNEFKFPIRVTAGGLCAEFDGEPCVGSTQKPTADCLRGQDALVDCRALDPCQQLTCDDEGDITTAHCPGAGSGDFACCTGP